MSQPSKVDPNRMVQLTLSNAVDQTQKIRVEVPAGTSVAQAARDAGIAPKGSFDVFTPGGEAVTKASVDQHRDAVLYVGPQKVAGGVGEFVLEPEPGVEVAGGQPVGPKAVVFVSSCDPDVRHEVVPQEGQSVKDAAKLDGHTRDNDVDLVHVTFEDERNRANGDHYRCVVDMRSGAWSTHVLNLMTGVRHPHAYTLSSIPGTTTDSFIVCQGNSEKILTEAGGSVSGRLSAYLNHIASVLNS